MPSLFSLVNLGNWRAVRGDDSQQFTPGMHRASCMRIQPVTKSSLSTCWRRLTIKFLRPLPHALSPRKGVARQHRERSREWPFAFVGRRWTTMRRLNSSNRDAEVDGFWRNGIARQVWVAVPHKDSEARRLACDLALCSQALAPGSRRGNHPCTRVGLLHPKPFTKKQSYYRR